MSKQEAETAHTGTVVIYQGERYQVLSVKTTGIAAPLFTLPGLGLVSYRLCSLPKEDCQ